MSSEAAVSCPEVANSPRLGQRACFVRTSSTAFRYRAQIQLGAGPCGTPEVVRCPPDILK
jgi:hypothetical protein